MSREDEHMGRTTVGFLGTGLMGSGMARNLARKGFRVLAYNRTPARAQALAADGVFVADTAVLAVRDADAVVAMLPDTRALEELLEGGLRDALRPGSVLVDCSTSEPARSIAIAQGLSDRGTVMLDAPVFGSKTAAEAGELTFLVGGPAAAYETCRPLLDAMGIRTFYLGANGSGCQAKLAFNMVIAGTVQAFAEALAMARAAGLEPAKLVDVIMAGRARSGIIEMKAGPMITRDYTPFFALKHMRKDLDLITRNGRRYGLELPMAALLQDLYTDAMAAGWGERDFCAIVETLGPPRPPETRDAPSSRREGGVA
jgi:3-hydroxyisobutyrate dehydrogenase-like beta-hydroxyacid dehydrogenase